MYTVYYVKSIDYSQPVPGRVVAGVKRISVISFLLTPTSFLWSSDYYRLSRARSWTNRPDLTVG